MPVSINERSSSLPAAADIPMWPGNGEEATSHQAAELDVWMKAVRLRVAHLRFRASIRNGTSMNSRANLVSWRTFP
jgi:hypothetical protein